MSRMKELALPRVIVIIRVDDSISPENMPSPCGRSSHSHSHSIQCVDDWVCKFVGTYLWPAWDCSHGYIFVEV